MSESRSSVLDRARAHPWRLLAALLVVAALVIGAVQWRQNSGDYIRASVGAVRTDGLDGCVYDEEAGVVRARLRFTANADGPQEMSAELTVFADEDELDPVGSQEQSVSVPGWTSFNRVVAYVDGLG